MSHYNDMDDSAPPIIEDARLPEMSSGDAPVAAAEGMADDGHQDLPQMADVEAAPDGPKPVPGGMDDIGQPAGPLGFDAPVDENGPAYLRLVVSFAVGSASVISVRLVDGELARSAPHGDMMYQALVDGRAVAFGGLPDATVAYGTPPEDDVGAGHSSMVVDSGDFVVRVPVEEVTLDELERLTIELTSPGAIELTPAPGESLQDNALAMGLDVPDTVLTIDGIDLGALPDQESEALRQRMS